MNRPPPQRALPIKSQGRITVMLLHLLIFCGANGELRAPLRNLALTAARVEAVFLDDSPLASAQELVRPGECLRGAQLCLPLFVGNGSADVRCARRTCDERNGDLFRLHDGNLGTYWLSDRIRSRSLRVTVTFGQGAFEVSVKYYFGRIAGKSVLKLV